MAAGLSIGRKRSLSISCGIHLAVIVTAGLIGHLFICPPELQAEPEILIPLEIESEAELPTTAPLAQQTTAAAAGQSGGAAAVSHKVRQEKQPERLTTKLQQLPVRQNRQAAADRLPEPVNAAGGEIAAAVPLNSGNPVGTQSDGSAGDIDSGDGQGAVNNAAGDGGSEQPGRSGEPGGTGTAARTQIDLQSIINRFASRVERNKEYPYMAVRRGQTGVVNVFVILGSGGSLEQVSVSSSSGVKSLDDSAVRAVRASCPFEHGAGRSLEMTIPIHYELKG